MLFLNIPLRENVKYIKLWKGISIGMRHDRQKLWKKKLTMISYSEYDKIWYS